MVKAKQPEPARISMRGLKRRPPKAPPIIPPIILPVALLATLLITLLAGFPAAALGQSGNLYFLSVKRGLLDTSTSGDTFIDYLETSEGHGALLTGRQEDTIAFEQDIYAISGAGLGLGVGLEILSYKKQHVFQDGETLDIVVKGVHFTLKTYLRLGGLLPFLGAGIGNYYVNLNQSSGLSLRISPKNVYNLRAGLFFLASRSWGLVLEAGQTSAEVEIPTATGSETLELGGSYATLGLSYVF